MLVVAGGSPSLAAANPGLAKLLAGAIGLPMGLFMVVLTGGELFTGNVFVMLSGLLAGRVSGAQLASNWALSFSGNLAGSLFAAALVAAAGTTAAQPFLGATLGAAAAKTALPFAAAFARGVLCNWMVCTAVWCAIAAAAPASKFVGIWLLVSGFVAMGFEHSVANMFIIPLGACAAACAH